MKKLEIILWSVGSFIVLGCNIVIYAIKYPGFETIIQYTKISPELITQILTVALVISGLLRGIGSKFFKKEK